MKMPEQLIDGQIYEYVETNTSPLCEGCTYSERFIDDAPLSCL